jgi:hypothetical protein
LRSAAFGALAWGIAALAPLAGIAAISINGANCALYAREVTGIDLQGNAGEWWDLALGRYARGHKPVAGAVLVFKPSRAMPSGHVAVVSRVIAAREILVDQANWIPGEIVENMSVIDVSPANDWTVVKVEELRSRTHGRDNAAFGFVYPSPAPPQPAEIRTASIDWVGKPADVVETRPTHQEQRVEQSESPRPAPAPTERGGRLVDVAESRAGGAGRSDSATLRLALAHGESRGGHAETHLALKEHGDRVDVAEVHLLLAAVLRSSPEKTPVADKPGTPKAKAAQLLKHAIAHPADHERGAEPAASDAKPGDKHPPTRTAAATRRIIKVSDPSN